MSGGRTVQIGLTWAVLLAAGAGFLGFIYGMLSDAAIEDKEPVYLLIVALIAGGTVALRGPLGRAIAKLLDPDATGGGVTADVEARLQALEAQLDEAQRERGRVLELEERIDFAERLLAERREVRQVQP